MSPQSSLREVTYPLHVIFDLNGVFLAMKFNSGPPTRHGRSPVPSRTICLKPRLKDFLEWCLVQFELYIWFVAQRHNIKAYLNKIYEETQIRIDFSKIFR